MKLFTFILIDIIALAAFWGFIFLGGFDAFNTIVFFEPEFVYVLIGISVLTGIIIGVLWEMFRFKELRTHGGDTLLCLRLRSSWYHPATPGKKRFNFYLRFGR